MISYVINYDYIFLRNIITRDYITLRVTWSLARSLLFVKQSLDIVMNNSLNLRKLNQLWLIFTEGFTLSWILHDIYIYKTFSKFSDLDLQNRKFPDPSWTLKTSAGPTRTLLLLISFQNRNDRRKAEIFALNIVLRLSFFLSLYVWERMKDKKKRIKKKKENVIHIFSNYNFW